MKIVNCLSSLHGYRSFLEISTATTGMQHHAVNRDLFERIDRLSYNTPSDFDDGSPVSFRSPTFDVGSCLGEIENNNLKYDLILVDPYHDYDCSLRDIEVAYRLIDDGGAIVVHDCLPPFGGELISPSYVPDAWCGVTFIAYVDFLMDNNVWFETIDCDLGCGIIFKRSGGRRHSHDERQAWSDVRDRPEIALEHVKRNNGDLIGLISPDQFIKSLPDEIRERFSLVGKKRSKLRSALSARSIVRMLKAPFRRI